MKRFVRGENNYDVDAASRDSGMSFIGIESMAKQSFREECDINTIVRKFIKTGELPGNVRMPTYGDFTGIGNFHEAMDAIIAAEEAFMQLPAEVRYRFHNDPGELVEFCSDEKNKEEARKLGLVPAVATPPVVAVQGGGAPGGSGAGGPVSAAPVAAVGTSTT